MIVFDGQAVAWFLGGEVRLRVVAAGLGVVGAAEFS